MNYKEHIYDRWKENPYCVKCKKKLSSTTDIYCEECKKKKL